MPVREALQSLEQEGFLERGQNRHMQVVALDTKQIEDTFHIIANMESEMILLIGDSKKDLSELTLVLSALEEAVLNNKIEKTKEMELEYHKKIAMLLKNKYLESIFIKFLDGYITYTVKELPHDEKVSFKKLMEVTNCILLEPEKVKVCLKQYYTDLAQVFIKHWEVKENE